VIITYSDYQRLNRIRSLLLDVFEPELTTRAGVVDWDAYRTFWRLNVLQPALPDDYYEQEYVDTQTPSPPVVEEDDDVGCR
jgi:hypothetical protein